MENTLIGAGILLGYCAAVSLLLLRRTSDQYAAAFADAYQLELTPTNVAQLRALVLRSRRFRFVGAAIATAVFTLWRGPPGFWGLLGTFAVGFGLGSIVDELQRPIEHSSSVVAASLDRRTLRTYIERWVLVATALMLVLTCAQAWSVKQIDPIRPTLANGDWILRRLAAVGAAAVFGGIALRRIVQAPAIHDRHDLQAVRHAVRMAGVLSVIGAVNVISGAVALSFANLTMLNDNGLTTWWQWTNNLSLVAAFIGFYNGIVLSIRAFPRSPLFRQLDAMPRALGSNE